MTTLPVTRLDLRGVQVLRLGIVSDTHGWVDPRVLDAVSGCDLLLHAGDVCGTAVLEALLSRVPRLIAVAGNNDRPGVYATDSGRLVELHEIAEIRLDHGLIALEHGHRLDWRKPSHADLRRSHPSARLVVYGHTHGLVCDTRESPWVANPGAAGRVRTRGGPSWIEVSTGNADWRAHAHRFEEAAA